MKKLISIILLSSLLPLVALSGAHALTDSAWQWGKEDKSTPSAMPKNRDVQSITFAIAPESWENDFETPGDRFQVFVDVGTKASMTNLTETSYLEIFIDSNLDKVADFSLKFTPKSDDNYAYAAEIYRADGTVTTGCEPYIWATDKSYAASFNAACLKPRADINISVRSTPDGSTFDLLPDKGAWQKFKTQYLKVATCNSGERNKKLTYDGTTYICMKSGGKWAWKDYAPIAAKNAKWLTEKAYYSCKLNTKFGASIEDGGKTLTLDGAYKYLITDKDYRCVTRVLKMPASVERRVGMTRALDGVQEGRWGKINAFWNYDPQGGLSITFSYN